MTLPSRFHHIEPLSTWEWLHPSTNQKVKQIRMGRKLKKPEARKNQTKIYNHQTKIYNGFTFF
ncbi:hypothetical protein Hanom_Chr13g01240851 [Helianthus anomalus]